MQSELAEHFERRSGRRPQAGARAPGRANLIGEHTDYNEGLVLPCAVDRATVAWVAPRSDGRVRAFSREEGEAPEFEVAAPRRLGHWVDYVQGVVFALRERGVELAGFDCAVASDVPGGAGLSSSAALEVAVVTALDACFELGLGPEACARLAHRAENGFVGVACGIMDPFASALGRRDAALRIDCRSERVETVALPAGRVALLLAHSGVRRELAAAGYDERVAECREAFAAARTAGVAPAGARALRDFTPADLTGLEAVLEPRLLRRVRHVVSENARVDAVCAALAAGDLAAAGALLREGMRSLREDFEVSTPELDALCEEADALPGVHGSRLTGAGFGGCSLHLVAPEAADAVADGLAAAFERRFSRRPPVWAVRAAEGAHALPPP